MGNWFTNKIAAAAPGRPAAPPPQPPYPVQGYPPQPQPVPGTWFGTPPAQQYAPGMPAPGPAVGRPQVFSSFTADGVQTADDGHVALLYDTGAYYAQQGGTEDYVESVSKCPNCRKDALVKIDKDENGRPRIDGQGRPKISHICMECNYPNVQSGSPNGMLGKAKTKGPTKAARQLRSDHVVTVVEPGSRREISYDPQPQRY